MTTEIDILKMAVNECDKAIKIKKMNERLFEQLTGSLYYICKYAEKHNLPLPEKELTYDMIKRCQHQFENIFESVSPPKNKHPFSTPDDETEPKNVISLTRLERLAIIFWISNLTFYSHTARLLYM